MNLGRADTFGLTRDNRGDEGTDGLASGASFRNKQDAGYLRNALDEMPAWRRLRWQEPKSLLPATRSACTRRTRRLGGNCKKKKKNVRDQTSGLDWQPTEVGVAEMSGGLGKVARRSPVSPIAHTETNCKAICAALTIRPRQSASGRPDLALPRAALRRECSILLAT